MMIKKRIINVSMIWLGMNIGVYYVKVNIGLLKKHYVVEEQMYEKFIIMYLIKNGVEVYVLDIKIFVHNIHTNKFYTIFQLVYLVYMFGIKLFHLVINTPN